MVIQGTEVLFENSVAPNGMAPGSVAPNGMAPGSVAPNGMAPGSVAPNSGYPHNGVLDDDDPIMSDDPYESELTDLECSVKFLIHNPKTGERLAFGPGVAALCEGVREFGSLSSAAKSMNMSYSKAWKIVGEAEDALDLKLVVRQKPKGFTLTDNGERLLNAYLEISEDITKYASFRFQQKLEAGDQR